MPAAVQPLRPSAAPAARSGERARLSEAIRRYSSAAANVARVVEAQALASSARVGAFLEVERVEAVVNDAAAGEPARRTAALLGEPADGSLSVPQAQRALAEARAAYAAAKDDDALLERAAADAETRLGYARSARAAAIVEVLQTSPELGRLFDALEAARDRVEAIKGALRALGPTLTQRQGNVLDAVPDRRDDGPVADAWRAALAALDRDPDAPLPAISDEPPTRPEAA